MEQIAAGITAFARAMSIAGPSVTYHARGHEYRSAGHSLGTLLAGLNTQKSGVLTLPLRAERIVVRGNVRLFGMDALPGTTARIALKRQRARSTLRDWRARRLAERIARAAGFGVPLLLAVDRPAGRWSVEKHVPGMHARPADMAMFACLHAACFYGATARICPVRRWGQSSRVPALNALITAHVPAFRPLGLDEPLLFAFCHNDLAPDNALSDEAGRLWLLDWERAGPAPVASDAARLCIESDVGVPVFLELLARLDDGGSAVSPARQLALGLAFCVQRALRMRESRIRRAVVLDGKSETAAIAAFNMHVGRARSLLTALRPFI